MTKKISDNMQIGIAIVGLAIAYATFSGKKEGEGGTGGGGGGGLDIPFIPDLSGYLSPAPAPAPDVSTSEPLISGSSLRSFFETSLQLNPDTYAATGKKTYSGQRTVGDTTYDVQGTLYPSETGKFSIDPITGQGGYDLNEKVSLYTEGTRKSTPAISKKSEPVFTNKIGGSSSNQGGTWVDSTFYRGKYQ